jgi:hypothetical protein
MIEPKLSWLILTRIENGIELESPAKTPLPKWSKQLVEPYPKELLSQKSKMLAKQKTRELNG